MTTKNEWTIGQLAAISGCKVQTIRYYEQIGLLPTPVRTAGQQRRYYQADIDRLRFVRHSRDLGFALDDIRELMTLAEQPGQSCQEADRIARRQLLSIRQRIRQLQALATELTRMIEQCEGDAIEHCRVIEVLADHRLCVTEDHTLSGDSPPPGK